jgi:hypothetical protein
MRNGLQSEDLEQFRYGYDAAGNLNYRTNNGFVLTYNVDNLNQLTSNSRQATNLTVAGTTSATATSVTVNTSNTVLYADATFASTNHTLVNGLITRSSNCIVTAEVQTMQLKKRVKRREVLRQLRGSTAFMPLQRSSPNSVRTRQAAYQ